MLNVDGSLSHDPIPTVLRSGLNAIGLRVIIPIPRRRLRTQSGGTATAVNRILTVEQIRMKFRHLGAAAEARRKGIPLPWDDPAWQERIRHAKQQVAEHEACRNEC